MKLSIITVNLNNSPGLRKTIESVVCQTYTDYEFIIIDGGSSDGSVDLIKEYNGGIGHWISEPDNGIYNAMNKGIKMAKGDYCIFLNSGDFLYSMETIEQVFQGSDGIDILYGDVLLSLSSGETRVKKHPSLLSFFYFYIGTICHQAAFIKRQLFDEYGLYNESYKIVSDWDFFIRTIVFSDVKTRHIDQIISVHNTEGFGNQNPKLYITERQQILDGVLPTLVLADYDQYKNNYSDIQSLFNIKKYKLSYFVFKVFKRITSVITGWSQSE